MNRWTTRALSAAFVAALGLGTAARAAEPTTADMADQIRQLREEVTAMKAQKSSTDLSLTPSAAQSADAPTLADGAVGLTAGYDKGLFIRSENGRFVMKPGLLVQFRHVTTYRENGKNGGADEDIQNGFEVRRMKPYLGGNLFGSDIRYRLQLANDRNASGIVLEDIWMSYDFNKQWTLTAGQFKSTVSHEESGVSDIDQLAVERSLMNDLIGQNAMGSRQQGVMLSYKGPQDKLHASAIISDGENTINTNFQDTPPDSRPRIGGFLRADYKLGGEWSDHTILTAKGTKADTFVLGCSLSGSDFAGAAIYRGEVGAHYVIKSKWNIYGAVTGALTEPRGAGLPTRFDYGGLIQAGYLLNPEYEVFGRADVVRFDQDFVANDDIVSEWTLGMHRYLGADGAAGNNARLTLDFTYLPNAVPTDKTGLGYLANGGGNEFVLRLQFQIRI